MRRPQLHVALGIIFLVNGLLVASRADARTLEFSTREVTDPELSVSPDGRDLVFSALGHLFRLPISGGEAEQLTFGSSYDSEPAYSPDGFRVAFISDRDGTAGNAFLLELSTRAITPLTREPHAGRLAWSPDGKSIAYCRILSREDHPARLLPRFFGSSGLRELRTMVLPAGHPDIVAGPRVIGSVFYLRDGRLAWTVVEQVSAPGSPFPSRSSSKIEVLGPDGKVATLRTAEGDLGRIVVGPAGDGLYSSSGGLQFLPLPEGAARPIPGFSGGRAGGAYAVAPDNKTALMAQEGQLFSVTLATGARRAIEFSARVKMDVREPVHHRWTPPRADDAVRFRSVLSPQLSPDGKRLVFMAAGDLWQQPVGGGEATRLVEPRALYRDPALSPDGRHLAYAQDVHGKRQVLVYDLTNRQVRRSVDLGDRSWGLLPAWNRHGTQVVFQQSDALFSPLALMAIALDDGPPRKLADATSGWTARPQFSADGQSLYFTGRASRASERFTSSRSQPPARSRSRSPT